MLVLQRKRGEKIHIGDDIIVTIVDIYHDRIRVGIDAPKDVTILRDEIVKRMQEGNVRKVKE